MKRLLPFFFALFCTLASADTKISALPAGTTLAGTEALPAVQSAATVKTTPAAISTYVEANLTSADVISKWTGTCDATTYMRADGTCQAIAAPTNGNYTPTCTAGTNIDTSTCSTPWYWARVGNNITVSGFAAINPTAGGNAASVWSISLPTASNFTANGQLGGTCSMLGIAQPMAINSNPSTDRADVNFASVQANNDSVNCIFQYVVLP